MPVPNTPECLPAAQSLHAVAPVALTYLPAAQTMQVVAADALAYLPASHVVQARPLAEGFDLPATHSVHLTCPSPSKPASHVHALRSAVEVALAAHAKHDVAPVVFTYLPVSQASHCIAADVFE